MSKIEIDFANLKYNLYEVLNVPEDCDDAKIKKNFVKIIKNFHPDKNSELEEEIYYHIILANQILLNRESRRKYDDYLLGKADTFYELKDSFKKSSKDVDHLFPNKDVAHQMFGNKISELNKKHGYSEDTSSESVMERFNKVKENRNSVRIEKEEFRNVEEFNQKFSSHKKDGGKFHNQIVEYKGAPSELSTYVAGEHFTSLQDIDKLYIEDSVTSSKYSSLDRAFSLQPTNIESANKSTEDKMNEYKNMTNQFKNMKPTEFSPKKFNEW